MDGRVCESSFLILILISVFFPFASCLLITWFSRWSNVDIPVTCSYASDPTRFSSSLLSLFPCLLLTALFHVPSIQIMLECTPPSFHNPQPTLTPHTAALPGDIPLQILLQNTSKAHLTSSILSPQLALRILWEVSIKEFVRAGLVSFSFSHTVPFHRHHRRERNGGE